MQADFAIITIREDEYQAVADRFSPQPWHGTNGRTYGISQIQTKDGKNSRSPLDAARSKALMLHSNLPTI